jgi:hypothetical protein
MKGLVAFVRASAIKPLGACGAALHLAFPTSHWQLDRNEDSVHPGEASA